MRNNDTSNDATTARRVMVEEAKSIISSAEKLDDSDIEQAIEILFKTSGKIIITGIGKSGHVGKKMAATLSSTGAPAYFLHPSEAVHGDLGIHQTGDPVIYLSNSGTTPELIYLEPVFRSREAKIIGILGNPNSPLGKSVDVCIDASVDQEADPLRIVPTASFAVASSIGDGIASCLMKRRNLLREKFRSEIPIHLPDLAINSLDEEFLTKLHSILNKNIGKGLYDLSPSESPAPSFKLNELKLSNNLLNVLKKSSPSDSSDSMDNNNDNNNASPVYSTIVNNKKDDNNNDENKNDNTECGKNNNKNNNKNNKLDSKEILQYVGLVIIILAILMIFGILI